MAKAPKRTLYITSLLVLLVLLFVVLVYLRKEEKPAPEAPPVLAQAPAVVIVDTGKAGATGGSTGDVPIYPKDLPKYSNSQQPLDYQQVGILTSNETDKEPVVLPLFGRKVYGRSDRWQYYTATDKNNMMRIPLNKEGRACEDDVGCQEIYNGDKLTVEIYAGREFTATVYKTDAPRYFASPY